MKRILVVMMYAVLVASLLVGCGTTPTPTPKPTQPAAAVEATPTKIVGIEGYYAVLPTTEPVPPGVVPRATPRHETGYRIGFARNGDAPYNAAQSRGMRAKATELGVELVETNAKFDAAVQAEQIRDLVSRDLDGLIVMPCDGTAVVPVLAEVYQQTKQERGTPLPIFILNAAIDPSGDPYTIGFSGPDDVAMGKQAAELMAQALGGKGNVLMVSGSASPPAILRRQGFMQGLAKYPDIQVIDDQPADWDPNKAIAVTRDMLTRHQGKVQGVFAHDDGMAEGAVEALKAAGFKPGDIKVVGLGAYQSGLRMIKDGWMYGTVLQDPDMDGALAMESLVKYLRGQNIPRIQYLAAPVVTKDNVDLIQVRF